MNRTLLPIRLTFVAVCAGVGWLLSYTNTEWDNLRWLGGVLGLGLGILVVLTDLMLKGFSLRGLSAITFGLAVGTLVAHLIATSPIFFKADPQSVYLSQLTLYLVCTYLCTVIALRGKDEFNLVIPYVRFVPTDVVTPLIIVDTSALIDGRVVKLCETGFLSSVLVIPQFVIDELQSIADSTDSQRQNRGRRGLETLAALRKVPNLEIRIPASEVSNKRDVDAKLVFLAQTMKARILTMDMNLTKLAEFQGVHWLNLHGLVRALRVELAVGQSLEVELSKPGKEEGQAVGFLDDGNMVVVEQARSLIGRRVSVEVSSVVASGGGKIVFGRLVSDRS